MPHTILITGCSSGFGRVTALHFARLGWQVIATVRTPQAAEALGLEAAAQRGQSRDCAGCPPPRIVIADITRPEDVARLAAEARAVAPTLEVLLNNAGTAFPGPLALLPPEDLRAQMEVNLIAHHRVMQAVLPLVQAAGGTIINVSSMGGRIAFPITGAYHASKFALEAWSDSLRYELTGLGVKVVVVEPGGSPTAIWQAGEARGQTLYADNPAAAPFRALIERYARLAQGAARHGFPPGEFAALIERIAHAKQPAARYVIGRQTGRMLFLRWLLPDALWDRVVKQVFRL